MIDAIIPSKWFGLSDMPYEMDKQTFERRMTLIVGDLGHKRRAKTHGKRDITVYFYVPEVNMEEVSFRAEHTNNKELVPKQVIKPYQLTKADKMFNLMMGA